MTLAPGVMPLPTGQPHIGSIAGLAVNPFFPDYRLSCGLDGTVVLYAQQSVGEGHRHGWNARMPREGRVPPPLMLTPPLPCRHAHSA